MCSKADLERESTNLANILLHPWKTFRLAPKSRRFKSFWSGELDRLAKQRTFQYRRAIRQNTEFEWEEYYRLDEIVKRKAKNARNTGYSEYLRKLSSLDINRRAGAVARCIKAKTVNVLRIMPSERRIEPAELTRFIGQQFPQVGGVSHLIHSRSMKIGLGIWSVRSY